jgi:photosystem II stability/assembly factor-like uncharacterized protein
MLTSAAIVLLLSVVAQKDADRMAPPERPVLGFPSEEKAPVASKPASGNSVVEQKSAWHESFLNDARLADVCFVDGQCGWAVGDRGAVWHTEDGGRQWQLQPCGVNCPLHSVCFLTRKIGWVAGGSAQPYSHTGAGALLATRDGGKTWSGNSNLTLPELKKILFNDPQHGWAIGFHSALYRARVFATDDGGRNWRPVFGSGDAVWLTGDFPSSSAGALAGLYGAAATVRGDIEPFRADQSGLRNLRQLRLVPPLYGWLVGDGGLVMLTANSGAAWQAAAGDFPAQAARHFDFAALAVRGPKAWIAGTPGTRVFFTPDAGASWTAFSTGVSVPISAMTFIDDEHGWAVGALGTILATGDGGRTWQRQRSAAARAAILGLFARADDVPLELLARFSGNDGYLSAVEVLTRRDVEVRPDDDVPLAERLQQAVAAVGGSFADVAWQFPLRQKGVQLTEEHYRGTTKSVSENPANPSVPNTDAQFHNPDSPRFALDAEALQEHLVRQLRLWRPEVVVTNNTNCRDTDQLGPIIGKAVLQAVDKAGDPAYYAGQIAEAGLSPWRVKKVCAPVEAGAHGSIDLSASQLSPRLGRSLADAAAEPRGLIADRFRPVPASLEFVALADRAPDSQHSRDLMAGIVLTPGGDARRDLAPATMANVDAQERMALKQRNALAILEQAQRNSPAESNVLLQSGELIRDLDENTAARILYRIADQYHRSGRWPLAAQSYAMLAERYPRHPLSRQAMLWLVRYQSSGEVAWQEQAAEQAAMGRVNSPGVDPARLEQRLARAAALGVQIEHTQPELFTEPEIRFPLAAAWRKQGSWKPAEQFYLLQARSADQNVWAFCAQGELSLAEPKNKQAKPVQKCWKAPARPRLDGRLNDALWQKVETVPLKSELRDDDDWPAVAAFAHDDEFLYIAVTCRRAPGVKYEPAQTPRTRDADLSGQDRVDVVIDVDRDFATYYCLSFDCRGFTADALWGSPAWDPTWFVAADLTDETWTVEAAVPFSQITGPQPPPAEADASAQGKTPPFVKSRDVWAVGVQRTIPGVGFQDWSAPSSTDVKPEGFGYLIFE